MDNDTRNSYDDEKKQDNLELKEVKYKNKLLYILTIIVIIIIYLVIHLSGKYLKGRIYVDNLPNQPVNNIKGVEEKENNKPPKDNNDNKPVSEDGLIDFVYTEDKTYGNYIYLINQFPTADEVGKSLEGQYKTFDFKLKFNKKSQGIKYQITLNKMDISDLENSWVKVYLENEGKGLNNCYRTNGRIKTFDEYPLYNNDNSEIILYNGVVTDKDVERGYQNYRLRMWISEDVKVVNQDYLSKTIVAKVVVHASGNI